MNRCRGLAERVILPNNRQRRRQHHKQRMTKENRKTLQVIAARFTGRQWRCAPDLEFVM
jgi:hypothetical protein